MLSKLKEKEINILSLNGIGKFFKLFFSRYIYRRQAFALMNYDLGMQDKKYKASSRWRIREFTATDLDKTDMYLKKYKEDYQDLFAIGCKAFGAFETGSEQLVALICYADKDFYDKHYQKHTYTVAPHQVYQFAGEVAESYRMTAVSYQTLQMAWKYWREKGKTEIYCSIDVTNVPSIRLHFHMKYKEIGILNFSHRLLGFRWTSQRKYSGEMLSQYKKKKIST